MPVGAIKFDIALTLLVDDRADNLILTYLAKNPRIILHSLEK
jgi:hypothetical protein